MATFKCQMKMLFIFDFVIIESELDFSLNDMKLTTFLNSALVILETSIITNWIEVIGSNAATAHQDLTRALQIINWCKKPNSSALLKDFKRCFSTS